MRTPPYHPLESPLHYILRLSDANGYVTPSVVMQLAVRDEDWRVLARWDYTRLNAVLPPSRHVPPTFGYRWLASSHICDLSLLGKHLLSRHLSAPSAGICPACIRESGYASAWWDLKYAIACPTHTRMLVHNCPGCGRRLTHLRRGLLRCSCGASLEVESRQEPTADLLWLMALLKHKVEAPVSEAPKPGEHQRPLTPTDLNLSTLCRIIEAVGRVEREMRVPGKSSRSFEARVSCLPSIASFLNAWPQGVEAFCSRWRDHIASHAGAQRSFRADFAWVFQGLLKDPRLPRHQSLFVVDAVLHCEMKRREGSHLDVRSDDLKRFVHADSSHCSLIDAAKLSGIPQYTLARLARKERLPCRMSNRAGRPRYEILVDVARDLKLDYHDALTSRRASRLLGITHNLYSDLRHFGVIKKEHKTMMPAGIAICDLQAFKQRVLSKASRMPRDRHLQSLDELRRNRCPRKAMVEIVKSIANDSIPCFCGPKEPRGIGELLVRMPDVQPIIIAHTQAAPATINQFMARYSLSYYEVRTLVSYLADSPVGSAKMPPGLLDRTKFDQFMSRHEGLTAYAQRHGVGYKAALYQLRQDNAKLLVIPVPRRAKQFVYFLQRGRAGRDCITESIRRTSWIHGFLLQAGSHSARKTYAKAFRRRASRHL